MANTAKEQLFDILQSINGSGNFVASGVEEFTLPGLYISEFGEVGMPINTSQAQALIKIAQQAPFGKGSKTITDTNVRSAWEIDASQLTFQNKAWDNALKEIVTQAKTTLGLEAQKVKAELYKLLIYEEGDFFLPHKDSEKAAGMFGTLVVGLPSKHSGGSLFVRFDGREEVVNLAEAASNYKIPYVAFYADCEHEIKPVRSGYRVCLVYNLIQKSRGKITSPRFTAQADELAELMSDWSTQDQFPKAILLDHEYTPSNFNLASLKQHDLPRAEALLAAAEKAGYLAKLGLVTHYQEGQLEDVDYGYSRRGRRGYYDYDDDETLAEEGSMGEIYEERTTISFVEDDNAAVPDFGEFDVDSAEIIGKKTIGEGKPTEKAAEGYTGNAGMTMEYWYHYGAVILWPQAKHLDFLLKRPFEIRLKWLDYYIDRLDNEALDSRKYVEEFIKTLHQEAPKMNSYGFKKIENYDPVAAALVKLNDPNFLKKQALPQLAKLFERISITKWLYLLDEYETDLFQDAFKKVGSSGDFSKVNHLLTILSKLMQLKETRFDAFLEKQLALVPTYLNELALHQETIEYNYALNHSIGRLHQTNTDSIQQVLALGKKQEADDKWTKATLAAILKKISRFYINEILLPIVLDKKSTAGNLLDNIRAAVIEDLQKRVDNKPMLPTDWSMEMPENISIRNQKWWKILEDFLASPTERVFDYAKRESDRREFANIISYSRIELETTTVRQGSPYKLRITKNKGGYNQKLKAWKEDVALLEKVTSA